MIKTLAICCIRDEILPSFYRNCRKPWVPGSHHEACQVFQLVLRISIHPFSKKPGLHCQLRSPRSCLAHLPRIRVFRLGLQGKNVVEGENRRKFRHRKWKSGKAGQILVELLLMEEILHQRICSLSHYLQFFIHPRWFFWSSEPSTVWFYPVPVLFLVKSSVPGGSFGVLNHQQYGFILFRCCSR